MIYIVGHNLMEAKHYAYGMNIAEGRWRYVGSHHDLRGIRKPDVIYVGDWYKRKDAGLIEDMVSAMWNDGTWARSQ